MYIRYDSGILTALLLWRRHSQNSGMSFGVLQTSEKGAFSVVTLRAATLNLPFSSFLRSIEKSFAVIFCCAALWPAVLRGESPDEFFTRASEKMAETTSLCSDFVQIKRLKAFRKPLKITGELCMDRTGRFAWHVKTPIRYSCVIADGKFRQWDADTGKTLTLDMDSNPALQYLARSLAGFFSGDFSEMRKDFEAVSVSPDGLSGEMRPRQGGPAANFIRTIRFFFADDSLSSLRRVVIAESSGDETDVEFLGSVRNQPIPEEKWRPDGK